MPPPATRRRETRPGTAGHTHPPCPAHQEVCLSSHRSSPAVVAVAVVLRSLCDVVLCVAVTLRWLANLCMDGCPQGLACSCSAVPVLVAPCANPASPASFVCALLTTECFHLLRCRASHWDCGPPRTVKALSHQRDRPAHHGVSWACQVPVSYWSPGVPHVTPSDRGA